MNKKDSLDKYYATCAVPKPKDKPKKRLENGYKNKANRYCIFTGEPYAERHEIFGGPNRQNSMKFGLQVDLCREIHERVTNPRTEKDLKLVRKLKVYGQKKFERERREEGYTKEQARQYFMDVFGKNYL